MRALLLLTLLTAPAWGAPQTSHPAKESDKIITERLIRESIAAYPGNCPCPYSQMRNGRRCGKRSAWSRPGGKAPLCYPEDVKARKIAAERQR
ncbi:hypothetical protein M8828_10460 [Aeromonas simiae]|uniref:hypothetical protein n=1 Tax=Aeromonas simiae TaxID=218936 RepID=UPI00266BDC00|nr:hypothetical protein [Aeromonas simiae]MDO2948840.1 hypothetical protein [Aeromonas simiae]MDO2956223.1 hypothetical protein [Aeromonas simiae]